MLYLQIGLLVGFCLVLISKDTSGAPDFWSALCRRMENKFPECQKRQKSSQQQVSEQPATTTAATTIVAISAQTNKFSRRKFLDYQRPKKQGITWNQNRLVAKTNSNNNDYEDDGDETDNEEDEKIIEQRQENQKLAGPSSRGQGSRNNLNLGFGDKSDEGVAEDADMNKVTPQRQPLPESSTRPTYNRSPFSFRPPGLPPAPPIRPQSVIPRIPTPTTFAPFGPQQPIPTKGFKGDPLSNGFGGGTNNRVNFGTGSGSGSNGRGSIDFQNGNNRDKDEDDEEDGDNHEDNNNNKDDKNNNSEEEQPNMSSFSSITKWCRKNKAEYKTRCLKQILDKKYCSKYARVCSFAQNVNHVPIQFGFSVNI